MNKRLSWFTMSVITLFLMDSCVVLGMKRIAEEEKPLVVRRNVRTKPSSPSMETIHGDLNKLFCSSLPNLNIVHMLTMSADADTAALRLNLPLTEKFALLMTLNPQRKKTIDARQEERKNLLLSLPAQVALARIECEFKRMQQVLHYNKFNVLQELREAYNIDPHSEPWRLYMLEAAARSEYNLEVLKSPSGNTTWNPDIPDNVIKILEAKIREKGLEPTAFDVGIVPNHLLRVAGALCQGAKSTMESGNWEEQKWTYKQRTPGYIAFNPSLVNLNDEDIDITISHELSHIMQCDIAWASSVVNAVVKCANVKPQEVVTHPAFFKLKLAQEICADTVAAIEDWNKVDACLRARLYPESYNVLAMIKTNKKVIEAIKAKEQFSMGWEFGC